MVFLDLNFNSSRRHTSELLRKEMAHELREDCLCAVKKANAIGFVDRGIRKGICFIPEIASRECWNCKECFPLCPTEALQAAFVLTEAFAFPGAGEEKKG